MEYFIIALLVVLVLLSAANLYVNFNKKPQPVDLAPVLNEVRNEFSRNRTESATTAKEARDELSGSINQLTESQRVKFNDFAARQDKLKEETESKLEKIRETVESRVKSLQEENTKKLDEMRGVVDEKLQATLQQRFDTSFKLISERLELVHKGLGEMQNLASGVGDLKKVLTNVKTRGNLGEIQLGSILEQFLSPEQYIRNHSVKNNAERVEFVIKLPGLSEDNPLFLSIDSKFPVEDYQRLMDAYESADSAAIETTSKQFENAVKKNAKDIRDKYINPPVTTDFAIMFVPTEGLYAEILRRSGLFEQLQKDFKVVIVGPTNLVAFLSSLQMGFRTLAVEKRSSEVWDILSSVKNEFGKFGIILDKTRKQLETATKSIDEAATKTRTIERRLKNVQSVTNNAAETTLIEDVINESLVHDEVA